MCIFCYDNSNVMLCQACVMSDVQHMSSQYNNSNHYHLNILGHTFGHYKATATVHLECNKPHETFGCNQKYFILK